MNHTSKSSPPEPTSTAHSHPTAPVRHSYPLAIRDASLSTAFLLFRSTLPYALLRFAILVGVSLLTVVWLGVTFGGAAYLFRRGSALGWLWIVVGGVTYGGVWHGAVRYFLYLLRAGHIAVLTELITQGSVSSGSDSMFAHGRKVVTARFGQVSALFALDLLIDGSLRAFHQTLHWLGELVPIPGFSGVTHVVSRVVTAATTYVDESMFSYNLARGDENVWRSSKDGLIYYAQNCQEILKTGAWVAVLDYALTAVAWFVLLAPAFVLSFLLPSGLLGSVGLGAMLIALLLAINVRSALLRPFFLTMVLVKFHVVAHNQPICEEWDARLTSASDKFRRIKDKALGATSAEPTATSSRVAPA